MSKKNPVIIPAVVEVEIPEPVEVVTAVVMPEPVRIHVVKDGDTYPSIAGLYKTSGVSKHEYAKHLFDLNKGKTLKTGMEVSL
jgi:hypothetical protein